MTDPVKYIPRDNHVARYCSPARCDGDEIYEEAFLPRENERGVSVRWLECFSGGREARIRRIRKDICAGNFTLKKDGRFAVLQVGAVREIPAALDVEHVPEDGDPSHSEIRGWPDDEPLRTMIAVELKQLIRPDDVFPALEE